MPNVSTTVDGFTPIFDCLVQNNDFGIIGASVFGRVWRYCQGERKVCQAAIGTIANELNMSTRTVIRWLEKLCAAEYLEDCTPELRNKPHTYRDTGKVKLQAEIRAAMTESHTDPSTVTESHSAMTESHSHYDLKSLEETKKRQVKRETPSPDGDVWPGHDQSSYVADSSLGDALGSSGVMDQTDPLSMMAYCARSRQARVGDVPDWAMLGAEGADPYYQVVAVFCTMTGQDPGALTSRNGKRWLKQYAKIAQDNGLSPGDMVAAHRYLPAEDRGAWYILHHKWGTPYADSYIEALALAGSQIKSGTIEQEPSKSWSRSL